ncbi:pantoate--beta-alanine ligase [SAR86 cluster bacterium]|nr:pantoate--beta-alanine ligase [SAR86 cluster bacterium]
METVENFNKLNSIKRNEPLALIPTMGNLHLGHLSLIRHAKALNLSTIVSIFINPLQFGPSEDFSKYPRTLEADLDLLIKEDCDFVFIPDDKELLHDIKNLKAPLNNFLCGKSRPGHFDGVLTIVNRFVEVIKPEFCIFGQKDFQQQLIIKEHLKKINSNTRLLTHPIVRDKNGLALSSRNGFLSKPRREEAAKIYSYLKEISEHIFNYDQDEEKFLEYIKTLKDLYQKKFSEEGFEIDYLELVNALSLESLKIEDKKILIAVAVNYAGVRLIDNICLTRSIS